MELRKFFFLSVFFAFLAFSECKDSQLSQKDFIMLSDHKVVSTEYSLLILLYDSANVDPYNVATVKLYDFIKYY